MKTESQIELVIGNAYQLKPVSLEERKNGTIYISGTRIFKLIGLHKYDAWIYCPATCKSFTVPATRLRNY